MSNHCRCRCTAPEPASPPPSCEPSIRRWPHPVACAEPESAPALVSIRRALECQTELLTELRDLLEKTNALLADGGAAGQTVANEASEEQG